MKSQVILSMAALSAFPIVGYANADVPFDAKAVSAKGAQFGTKVPATVTIDDLVPGIYKLSSSELIGGVAGDKLTFYSISGAELITDPTTVFTVGEAIDLIFEVGGGVTSPMRRAAGSVTIEFQAGQGEITFTPACTLIFDFNGVGQKLQNRYNEVVNLIKGFQNENAKTDLTVTADGYYQRILAISQADWDFYKAGTEGLQGIYADQSLVAVKTLDLYNALGTLETKQISDETTYFTGTGGILTELNAYYDAATTEQRAEMKETHDAANEAYEAWTLAEMKDVDKHAALVAAVEAYAEKVAELQGVIATLQANLDKVYKDGDETCHWSLLNNSSDFNGERYADLKTDFQTALAAYNGESTAYTTVKGQVAAATIATQTTVSDAIGDYQDNMDGVKTTFVDPDNGYKKTLDAAWKIYDETLDALPEAADTPEELVDSKKNVTDALAALKEYIEGNDNAEKIAAGNLTGGEDGNETYNEKVEAVTTAKENFDKALASYNGAYSDLLKNITDQKDALDVAAVNQENAELGTELNTIDQHALDKGFAPTTYKPSINWDATVTDIKKNINTLKTNLAAHVADAKDWSTKDEFKDDFKAKYTDPLKAITDAVKDLEAKANVVTDSLAIMIETKGLVLAYNTSIRAIEGIQELNVWEQQVTTDAKIKARTPYKTILESAVDLENNDELNPENYYNKTGAGSAIYVFFKNNKEALDQLINYAKLMEEISENYESDEEAFKSQVSDQEIANLKTFIVTKTEAMQEQIEALLSEDKAEAMGTVRTAKLQEYLNGVVAQIEEVEAVVAKSGVTKEELQEAKKKVSTTGDIAVAIAIATDKADTYKTEFHDFTVAYNNMLGTTADASSVNTYNGLLKYIAEKQALVDASTEDLSNFLSDAQKTTCKEMVASATYIADDVEYNAASVKELLDAAAKTQEETDVAKVTADIINGIKSAVNDLMNSHVSNLNELEQKLKDLHLKLTEAKVLVLEADPNEEGFWYTKVSGNESEGQYTFDYNALKTEIEAEEFIDGDEKDAYNTKLSDLRKLVKDAPVNAQNCLAGYKAAKDYLANKVQTHPATDAENWLGYDEALAELESKNEDGSYKYQSSQLETQLSTLRGFQENIDAQGEAIEKAYAEGVYEATGWDEIHTANVAVQTTINEYLQSCIGENYSKQIAKDNEAVYKAAQDALKDARAAYTTASESINKYANLESDELKSAASKADAEKQALLNTLKEQDEVLKDIQKRESEEYGSTHSPEIYDADYKSEYEAVTATITEQNKVFYDKIMSLVDGAATQAAETYATAIDASKERAKSLSPDDKELSADKDPMKTAYADVDDMLKAITDAQTEANIGKLDAALVDAADEDDGILNQINGVPATEDTALEPSIEMILAQTALDAIFDKIVYANLEPADQKRLDDIEDIIDDYEKDGVNVLTNFAELKSELTELKAKSDYNEEGTEACTKADAAVKDAANAFKDLTDKVEDFVVLAETGYVDVQGELTALQNTEIVAGNAAEVEADAKALKDKINGTEEVPGLADQIYDAEVAALDNLITKANEQLITYKGVAETAEQVKAAEDAIKAATDGLKTIKEEVAKDAKKIDKLSALKAIQDNLVSTVNTMEETNGVSQNAAVLAELNETLSELVASMDDTDLENYVLKDYSATVVAALGTQIKAINDAITAADTYINDTHDQDISLFKDNAESMLDQIGAQIVVLVVEAEKKQDAENQAAAGEIWTVIDGWMASAKNAIAALNGTEGTYGNGSLFATKISSLNTQLENAKSIYSEKKAESEELGADVQAIATEAQNLINEALADVEANCNEIIGKLRTAYVEAFIGSMNDEVTSITWNASDYSDTDNKKQTDLKNEILNKLIPSYEAQVATYTAVTLDVNSDNSEVIIKNATDVVECLDGTIEQYTEYVDQLKKWVKENKLTGSGERGHITGGDEIGAEDIQALADAISNGTEDLLSLEAADCNQDGEITITDVVWLQFYFAYGEWPDASAGAPSLDGSANNALNMEIISQNANVTRVAFNLNNETAFRAFQIGLQLPAGAKVVGQSLGSRVETGYLMHSVATEGNVRFMNIADADKAYAGNEGAVLYVDIENLNGGTVSMSEAYFVDGNFNQYDLTSNRTITGIKERIVNAVETAGQKVYDLGGRVMNGLKKGINIIRNADGSTTKVIKK